MEQIHLFKAGHGLKPLSDTEKPVKKTKILSILEDCHNYIYANEGVLKEKAFREITKLLFIKIHCENKLNNNSFFKITKKEFQDVQAGGVCKSFAKRIKTLYKKVSQTSELKIWNEGPLLSLNTTAYIVNRLQAGILKDHLGDIAGQAFQTFVHAHQRGERGEFFTPAPVVKLAIQMIQPKHNEKLIDPACGSGGFLFNAIDYVKHNSAHKKHTDYTANNIYGMEFNPDVALSAKLLLEIEGGRESNIICANALNWNKWDEHYDSVLTNPPFGRRGKIENPAILNQYDLGRKWLFSNNRWKPQKSVLPGQAPEILFIEKCCRLLKPEGRMAIVVPDGLLQNPSLGFVRQWIQSKTSVLAVVSLPYETFVPFGTGVKTSLLILKKNFIKKNVFFSKIKNIGYPVKNSIHYKNTPAHNLSLLTAIGHDIKKTINAFHNKKINNKLSSISWKIKYDMLSNRWDAEHYSLKDMQMIKKLHPGSTLSYFVNIVKNKENFSKQPAAVVRYVAISDIDRYGMKIADHQMLRIDQLPSRASYRIREGDILTAVSGANTGTEKQATALVSKEYAGAVCSNGFAVLRNVKNIDKYFLLAFLKTDIFIKQVRRMMTGHAIPCISLFNLERIIIPTFNRSFQKKFANKAKHIIDLSHTQHQQMQALKKEITAVHIKK